MFDFDDVVQTGSELLAQLGLDGRAILTILEEPAPYDPLGILGDVPAEQAVRIKTVLFALDVGLLLAVLVLLFRSRQKEMA